VTSSTVETSAIRILYIEDNEDDLIAISELLDRVSVQVSWASTLGNARQILSEMPFDLILLDHALPDGNGLSFIEELWWNYPEVPVVLITGHRDEALALSAIKKGAVNFVLKDEIRKDLLPVVEKSLGRGLPERPASGGMQPNQIQTDRITPWLEPYHPPADLPSNRFLERATEFYRDVLAVINEAFVIVDADGIITYANVEAIGLLGFDEKHLLGGDLGELFDEKTVDKLYRIRTKFKQAPSSGYFSIAGRGRGPGRP